MCIFHCCCVANYIFQKWTEQFFPSYMCLQNLATPVKRWGLESILLPLETTWDIVTASTKLTSQDDMVFFSLSLSPWKLTTLLRERRGHTERVHEIHVPVDSLGSQPTVSIKTKPCKRERLHVISAWPSSQTLVRAQTSYSHSALPDPNCRSISQINIIIYLSQDFLALPY